MCRVTPELLEKYDPSSRLAKAVKIERMLMDRIGERKDLGELCCLDVGCSIGVIASHMATRFGYVVGIDPLAEAIDIARQLHSGSRVSFLCGDGMHLPFSDEMFDVVVCAQVYEHTADPNQLVSEIWRTLKPGGHCFFSGPNRLWPIEYHYNWCCIHWLPRFVLRSLCSRPLDLILYNYWQLRALWQGFECHDYTLQLAYEPWRFTDRPRPYLLAHLIPRPVASILRFLLPNFNWVLIKGRA